MKQPLLVSLYLLAIVLANLSVAHFGANATIINAFLFIGLDLSTRDYLHEIWGKGWGLFLRLGLLILTGSILSALLNWNATPIAIASFVAFFAAGIVDSVIYKLLQDKSRFVKVNGSNLASSFVDSLVFPILAFGFPILWGIVLGQFLAKVLGGLLWSFVLAKSKVGKD